MRQHPLPITFDELKSAAIHDKDHDLWTLLCNEMFIPKRYRATSLRGYHSALKLMMAFLRESTDGSQFSFVEYEKWLKRSDFAPATVRKRIAQARVLISELCPSQGGHFTIPRAAATELTSLPYTNTEVTKLLSCSRFEERVIILLALDAALTVQEISRLRRDDVLLEKDTLLLFHDAVDRPDRAESTAGEQVFLSPLLKAELQRWFSLTTGAGKPEYTYVLANTSQAYINETFRKVCLRAQVPARGLRGLRVTAGARAYRETEDLQVVMHRLRIKTRQHAQTYAQMTALLERDEEERKEGTR